MSIRISKLLYILFIFYIGWFQTVFFSIPRMPFILGAGMILFLLINRMSSDSKIIITKPLMVWIMFAIYILLSGVFVAQDKVHLLNSWMPYVQTLALMFFIINVSIIENNNKFFVKSYLVYAAVYMLTMLLFGFQTYNNRLYLSEASNPNGDGLTLLVGVFCAFYLIDRNKMIKLVLPLVLIGLFVYTIILTGSRKSFLAAVVLILFWFAIIYKDYWKSYSTRKKILASLVLLSIVTIVLIEFVPLFLDSTLYSRLTESGYTISSDKTRSGMYKEAFRFFKENPLFGIGFNHFRKLSVYRTYSHSTYAEIISTTGIVGTLIYFSAYVIIIDNLRKIFIRSKGSIDSTKAMQYLILMSVMLLLGTGVIHFYGILDSIAFAFMISFCYTTNIRSKAKSSTRSTEY